MINALASLLPCESNSAADATLQNVICERPATMSNDNSAEKAT
jgi:hypothetical protein